MLIDHLIYRAPDLADAVAEVEERLGVRAQAGGQHTGLGTHNALLAGEAVQVTVASASGTEQLPTGHCVPVGRRAA